MADVADILARQQAKQKSTLVERETPMELDVGLLAVFDPNALEEPSYTTERESYLQSQARDGVQTLVNALFSLPTTSTSDAVIANLPSGGPTTALPRAKPLPKPKPLTKWERFAKAKGIAPKPKREKMVFDEDKQEWVARWGWKGKNKDEEQAWIREVKPGEEEGVEINPGKRARKERMLKNEQQRLKNVERAAAATSKSSASTAVPDQASHLASVNGSTTVRNKADLRAQKIAAHAAKTSAEAAARRTAQGERKQEIDGLLQTTKRSTASMGKFDKAFVGEPKKKGLKRKFEATELPTSAEQSSQLALVERLAKDPSAFAETAVKRGKKSSSAGSKKPGAGDDIINTRKAIRAVSGGVGSAAFADKADKRKGGKKR